MDEPRIVSREVVSLSRGSRLAVVVGVLLILLAIFLLLVPLEKHSSTGTPFSCGNAVNPADGSFARAVCGHLAERFRDAGVAVAVAAITVVAGGLWSFGIVRRVERRLSEGDVRSAEA